VTTAATARHRRSAQKGSRPFLVVAVLATCAGGLFALNASGAGRPAVGVTAAFAGTSALPVVRGARPSSWNCPGPLPTGSGEEHSAVEIANVSALASRAVVVVSEVRGPQKGHPAPAASAPAVTSSVEVPPNGEVTVALPDLGAPGEAAVSVEAAGGGVGVTESVSGRSGPLQSPCAVGAGPTSYVATGSTAGTSQVSAGLLNPNGTPAVVNVSVSTGSSLESPPAFQGVVVPAQSLVVLDVGRWAPQHPTVALSAEAVSGEIVLGALETTSEVVKVPAPHAMVRAVSLSGAALVVGAGSPLPEWGFSGGPAASGLSVLFAVFNPGLVPETVTVSAPAARGAQKGAPSLVSTIGAGATETLESPVLPGRGASPGVVVVNARATGRRSSGAVVVDRVLVGAGVGADRGLGVTEASAGPARGWLVVSPEAPAGSTYRLLLANPGSRAVFVRVTSLGGANGGASGALAASATVAAGGEAEVAVSGAFALRCSASALFFAELVVVPPHGGLQAITGIPLAP